MKTILALLISCVCTIQLLSQDDVTQKASNPRFILEIDNDYGGYYFHKNEIKGGLIYNHSDSTMRWSHTMMPESFSGLSMKTDEPFAGHLGLGTTPTQHYFTLYHNSVRVPGVVNHPDNTAHIALIEDDADDFARIWFLNSAYDDRWAVLARHGNLSRMGFAHNGINRLHVDTLGYLTINTQYTFPNTDGNDNEVLTTDGNGMVSWEPVNVTQLSDEDGDTKITLEELPDIDQINLYCENNLMINMKTDTMYIPKGVISGYGTLDPLEPIHIVAEDNDEYAGIYLEGGSGTNIVHHTLDNKTPNGRKYALASVANGSFVITDVDPVMPKERIVIDPNGYVGINEMNPDRQLHVKGSAVFEGAGKILDSLEVGVGLGAKLYIGNDFITDGGPDILRFDAKLVPEIQSGYDLGGNVLRWKDLYLADTVYIATSELFERGVETLVTNSHFLPEFNGLKDLGASDIAWKDLWLDNALILGSTAIAENNTNSAVVIDNSFVPKTDNAYQLGNGPRRWKEVFAVNGVINTSDKRAKTDINPLAYGLAEVMQLKPVDFYWKDKEEEKKTLGLLAQDLLDILPEVVVEPKNEEELLGVKYADIIPVLIHAIQEQQEMLDENDLKYRDLKEKYDVLSVQVEKLMHKMDNDPLVKLNK